MSNRNHWQLFIKNCLDRGLALVALGVLFPLCVIVATAIKLLSPGPILFCQRRVGQNFRPFTIYKFRTMHVSADRHQLGSVTVANDPRLFPGGRWLRKFKIDELPQLINVLNGTMSLVGPRPTVGEDYERMTPEQRIRVEVRPGITGLAQVQGGAAIAWPERIEYDLEYIRNFNLWLDAKILVKTVGLVFSGRADANPIDSNEWSTPDGPTSSHISQNNGTRKAA